MDTKKCIWMDAGVVDYQLCPLKQNCDHCDFHEEMQRGCRDHVRTPASIPLEIRMPDLTVLQFQAGLQYLPGHFWYKRIAAGRIRLGIDVFLWQFLTTLHKVVVPEGRTDILQNQCFCWLVINNAIIYLKTPIPGIIVRVNPRFQVKGIGVGHLHLLREEELWIVELEVNETLHAPCLSREQYFAVSEDDFKRFSKLNHSRGPLERVSDIGKSDFSSYLRRVSNNHVFIC